MHKQHFPRGTRIRASCDDFDRIIQHNKMRGDHLYWNERVDNEGCTNGWPLSKIKVLSRKIIQIY